MKSFNKLKNVFWCKNCVSMSTRPRISFDHRGFCSACVWTEEKKNLNWRTREKLLDTLLSNHRSKKNKKYDCITTVSGGKDGSYVTYNLKHKYKMSPLAITIRPPLETELGVNNLLSFINKGYDHIHVSPNPEAMRKLNKIGLIEMGLPYYGWLIAIHSAVLRIAVQFNIPLIFYSEDGEVEYGGDAKYKNQGLFDVDYIISRYLESGYEKVLKKAKLSDLESYWFRMPRKKELNRLKLKVTHYSFYESWDPYRNYEVAKKHCGLTENKQLNEGSYTNYSQTDQKLYSLHVYYMYIKFGFGRTNQDSCIDVRRGAMTREQAVQLINMYDNFCPQNLFEEYCDYYKINMKEFLDNIDKWANKNIFEKKKGIWIPKFKIV
jgi:N-acetyl sugar amidotransferase